MQSCVIVIVIIGLSQCLSTLRFHLYTRYACRCFAPLICPPPGSGYIQVHFADLTLAIELALLRRLSEFGYQLVNRDENWRHSSPMQTASPMFGCLELTYVYVGIEK
jgi:hypothetical protein